MKRLMITVLAVTAMASFASANTPVYNQGFESDSAGIVNYPGPVTRVASGGGTLGVTSANGGYHAEVALDGTYGDGFYTWNGGASSVWPGYIKQSISVYINPAAGTTGDGWFWDAGINNDGGMWARGGGFGVQKTGGSTWSLGAEDDYGGYDYVGHTGFTHTNNTPLNITTAGWYTLETEWVESTVNPPYIDQVNSVLSQSGGLLWTDRVNGVLSTPGWAGGISYSWLGSQGPQDGDIAALGYSVQANTMELLAVDNVYGEIGPAGAVPEPGTMLLLGTGALGLLGYARRRMSM